VEVFNIRKTVSRVEEIYLDLLDARRGAAARAR
jgi:hypothetical protein